MNMHESVGTAIGTLFGTISFVVGLTVMVFWMVVAWRAMRAHERIADAWERSTKGETDSDAVKPCASCGKPIPKHYTKCLHCGQPQP
jgi:uncharacterized membrane protein